MPFGNSRITGDDRNTDEQNTRNIEQKLTRAMLALANLPAGHVVPLEKMQHVIDAYHLLYSVTDYLPSVKCWAVVKHYAHHKEGEWAWQPAVWVGCTTKEQAEAIAPALQIHYEKQAAYKGNPDRFVVEERAARVTNILRPDLTVEEYMRGLKLMTELVFRAHPAPEAPRPKPLHLSPKMQVYIYRIMGVSAKDLQAVAAAKERYDIDKKEKGLASIKLIQMEVENALVLATNGKYKRVTGV